MLITIPIGLIIIIWNAFFLFVTILIWKWGDLNFFRRKKE